MASSPTHLDCGHFFGVNRLERRVAGFLFSETHYRGGLQVPPHVHALPYFAYLLTGGYQEHLGRQALTFGPQSFVFHPSHEVRHGRLSDAGARLFHVEFAPRCLEQMRAEGELLGDSVVRQVGPVVRLAQNLYREFRQTDSASTFAIEGLTLEIVGALLRAAPRADSTSGSAVPRWLVRVREQLDDEPSRHHTVQAIAVDAGVSPVRLSRAFRRTYGESLGSYQRRVRIRHACERLHDEETTLAAIALDAGFTDQSHFTRVFTRLIGITPAAFRREQREPRRSTAW